MRRGDGFAYKGIRAPVGEGEPLVLIHAGIADMRMWDPQVAPFAERPRVVRYDMRGFGQSPAVAGARASSRR